jgi:hypothetical protein
MMITLATVFAAAVVTACRFPVITGGVAALWSANHFNEVYWGWNSSSCDGSGEPWQ